ncbi:sigma factor G inhibitor Gin [Microbacteriaceae bacterium 4G12]
MNPMFIAVQKKVCIICEEEKQEGIFLYNGFICETCERDIVQTSTDHPKYAFYLRQLRKIQL